MFDRSGVSLCVLLAALAVAPAALAHPGGHEGHVLVPVAPQAGDGGARTWLAGDHHIHSRFSAAYKEDPVDPAAVPTPLLGQDGRYGIAVNAQKARDHGLAWMVSTDHGGPNHSKINHDQAYPELLQSRRDVPEVLQFYGMEFDTPGGDHSSLIVPHTDAERQALFDVEQGFSKRDAWPRDPSRDVESRMIAALEHMRALETPPVLIANHPSRSASDVGVYGAYSPAEFRDWNDTAPRVAVGMEGAPGHQAAALHEDGSLDAEGARGGYRKSPTLGGFDQMTARLGGFWDSMLGEGRRWWITSTSDSHSHWREGGSDFWPGEYSKTYVHAARNHADIIDGLRHGRVFVTTGDLISELDLTVAADTAEAATTGGELTIAPGQAVTVTIRLRDPAGANHAGRHPEVVRVDLIQGEVSGPVADRATDTNPTTRVARRFTAADWTRDGEYLTMSHRIEGVSQNLYLRLRGANTDQLEPEPDPRGEDPWSDLWFYSNPVFVTVVQAD